MILGIGIDLCRIARIRRSVDRLGDSWIDEVFTNAERDRCRAERDSGLAFARAFACKEACAKALGSGFANGVRPPDISLALSRTTDVVELSGKALRRLKRLTPAGHAATCRVTMSVLDDFVTSTVVIDAAPDVAGSANGQSHPCPPQISSPGSPVVRVRAWLGDRRGLADVVAKRRDVDVLGKAIDQAEALEGNAFPCGRA